MVRSSQKPISEDPNVQEYLLSIEAKAHGGSIEQQYQASLRRVSELMAQNQSLKSTIANMSEEIQDLNTKAQHWDIFKKAIDSHQTVKTQWEKFLFTLRLCQSDETEE
jgi:hypothetical protein